MLHATIVTKHLLIKDFIIVNLKHVMDPYKKKKDYTI